MTQRGFSLLEILVAFSILALSLGVLMQIFSGSLRNADTTHDQAQAVVLAQSLLDAVGIESPLAQGESAGAAGDRFRWLLKVSRFDGTAGDAQGAQPSPTLNLWEVTARVAWGGAAGTPERAVTLTTLRVQPVLGQ